MISHSKPYIDEADVASVSQALSENRLAGGYYVEKFENRIANYFETSGGGATNSGTTALPKGALLIRPARIRITVLPPVQPESIRSVRGACSEMEEQYIRLLGRSRHAALPLRATA